MVSCDLGDVLGAGSSGYARPVLIGDTFYLLDPAGGFAVELGDSIGERFLGDFFYYEGSVFASLETDTEPTNIVVVADLISGEQRQFSVPTGSSPLLVGSMPGLFVVEVFDPHRGPVLVGLDADRGTVVWELDSPRIVHDEDTKPLMVLGVEPNPTGSLIVVTYAEQEGPGFDVVLTSVGSVVVPAVHVDFGFASELHDPGDRSGGWFDENRILYRDRNGLVYTTNVETTEREILGSKDDPSHTWYGTGREGKILVNGDSGLAVVDLDSGQDQIILGPHCSPWIGSSAPIRP